MCGVDIALVYCVNGVSKMAWREGRKFPLCNYYDSGLAQDKTSART